MIKRADTLRDQAYNMIRDSIIKQELQFGERLSVADLARKYSISNSPIREAISRLENEGLVVNEPNYGFHVVKLTKKSFLDLTQSIHVLLDGCYDLCVREKLTDGLITLLEERYAIQKKAFSHKTDYNYVCVTIDVDRSFVDILDNDMLSRMFETKFNLLVLCTLYVYEEDSESYSENLTQHRELIDAVKKGDHKNVRDLLAHHYDKSSVNYTFDE